MTNMSCLGRIYSDLLLWFSSIFGIKWIRNLLRNIVANASFFITRCSDTESLFGKSACAELTGGSVSFYITRSSNTESLYGKFVCKELTWKICYLIYHAVIEQRAGTRDDISCWLDDPKLIILDQVFNAGLIPFLLRIFLVIRSSSSLILSEHFSKKNSRESPEVSDWVEWFVSFWVYTFTLVRGVSHGVL